MVKLRDYFESDFQSFFNTNEFAETKNVDGKEMEVVIDNDLLKEYQLKSNGEGLEQIELLFHVPKYYFERKPSTNNIMRVDKKIYRVAEVGENLGMYTILLARNKA